MELQHVTSFEPPRLRQHSHYLRLTRIHQTQRGKHHVVFSHVVCSLLLPSLVCSSEATRPDRVLALASAHLGARRGRCSHVIGPDATPKAVRVVAVRVHHPPAEDRAASALVDHGASRNERNKLIECHTQWRVWRAWRGMGDGQPYARAIRGRRLLLPLIVHLQGHILVARRAAPHWEAESVDW